MVSLQDFADYHDFVNLVGHASMSENSVSTILSISGKQRMRYRHIDNM